MFSRILLPALLAGSLAALVLTVAQALWVTPLILQAETYENAVVHEHEPAEAWQPETEMQRLLATTLGNTVLALGYGLIFMGLFLLRRPANALQGLGWGLAGFTVFFVAPSLGLPPELPGTASAELLTRQHWWLSTVAATALGLGLLFLQQRRPWQALGVLLLAMPHLIGAPQIAEPISLAPEALQAQFRLLTLACNALFWSLLGLLSAAAFRRFCR